MEDNLPDINEEITDYIKKEPASWYERFRKNFDKTSGFSNFTMLVGTFCISLLPPVLLDYTYHDSLNFIMNKDLYLVLAALMLSSLQCLLVRCGEDVLPTILFVIGCVASTVCIIIHSLLFQSVPEIDSKLQCISGWLVLLLIIRRNNVVVQYDVCCDLYRLSGGIYFIYNGSYCGSR